jgi:hypothetical protein
MERQIKQLGIKGNTYTLRLTHYPDGWECEVFQNRKEAVQRIRKAASEHEVKFLGHVIAYDMENMRRDEECERECESGWERVTAA